MVVYRENATKMIATGTAPTAGQEATVTIGTSGDGMLYHIKAVTITTTVATGATDIGFNLNDGTNTVFQNSSATQVAIGSDRVTQMQRVPAAFTTGAGDEVMVLPDKLIVPGGYVIDSVSETVANTTHGGIMVFGSVFKAN